MITSKLVKRGFLAMAFATAFVLVSFATSTDAEARGCRGGGYGGHQGGGYYGGYGGGYGRSYNNFQRGGGYYAPQRGGYYVGRQVVYNHGRSGGFYYNGGRGVSVGIGF